MEPNTQLLGLFTIIFSYLLGSIPSGYLAGLWLSNIDLRTIGSGSTGATNVLRHVGKWPALVVFVIDVTKGIIPVIFARNLFPSDTWQVIAGLTAIIAHIWPVWLGWKGGKAVATGLGVVLGLSWQVGIACLGIFLTVLTFSKIVSLSSITASISLPILMFLSFQEGTTSIPYLTFSLATMAVVVWRHRTNLGRIFRNQEPKINSR